jgi:hypothetical protein
MRSDDENIQNLIPHVDVVEGKVQKAINDQCFTFSDRVIAHFSILDSSFTNVTCVDDWDFSGIAFMSRKNFSLHQKISKT